MKCRCTLREYLRCAWTTSITYSSQAPKMVQSPSCQSQTKIQGAKSLPLLHNPLMKSLFKVKFASRLSKTSKSSRQKLTSGKILTLESYNRLLRRLRDKLRSFKMKLNSRKRKATCSWTIFKRKKSTRLRCTWIQGNRSKKTMQTDLHRWKQTMSGKCKVTRISSNLCLSRRRLRLRNIRRWFCR